MKKILFIFIEIFNNLNAQNQDIISLSDGDFVNFDAVFNKDAKLEGYVTLYDLGKVNDTIKKFEYVFLDKNLNKVSNKIFECENNVSNYGTYLDYKGNLILNSVANNDGINLFNYGKYREPVDKIVDLQQNTVASKPKLCYKDNAFYDCSKNKTYKENRKETKREKNEKGFVYDSRVIEMKKHGGYFVFDWQDYEKFIQNSNIIRFDNDKKELWRISYNKESTKKKFEEFYILEVTNDYLYSVLVKTDTKADSKIFTLQIFDMKTGEKKHEKLITEKNKYILENTMTDGFEDVKSDYLYNINFLKSNYFNNIGLIRTKLNKITFEYEFNDFTFESLKSYIPKIDENGGVESGYFLYQKDFYLLQDGSCGLLFEKTKPAGQYNKMKTTDLVYLITDKDFNVKEVKTFEKDKTKGWDQSDYLFSQYLNDRKDVVFFYRDYQKDEETNKKNWNLYINTLINGEFKQEKIQISSKDDKYYIAPYIAKEGYILLREYNEKEKYNQIRLEKLNY